MDFPGIEGDDERGKVYHLKRFRKVRAFQKKRDNLNKRHTIENNMLKCFGLHC